jgi:hypothetical protein
MHPRAEILPDLSLGSDMEIHMRFVDSRSPLGSEFDKFLFAPLGEDENGLPLSVVTLLARIDLDPWQEAGDLAALPLEAAARRLTCLLGAPMGPVLQQANSETMVLRLLALLPPAMPVGVRTPPAGVGSAAAPAPGSRIGLIILITSAIFLLGSQFIGGHRDTSIQPQVVHGPSLPMSPSQTPPPNPGH